MKWVEVLQGLLYFLLGKMNGSSAEVWNPRNGLQAFLVVCGVWIPVVKMRG